MTMHRSLSLSRVGKAEDASRASARLEAFRRVFVNHERQIVASRYFDAWSAFLLFVRSRAAFKPFASFTASSLAQKCM